MSLKARLRRPGTAGLLLSAAIAAAHLPSVCSGEENSIDLQKIANDPHELVAFLVAENPVVPPWPNTRPFLSAFNREAPVPPQCYTRHEAVFNPCYVCHQNERPGSENQQNDGGLQASYDFSDLGFTNHWTNLFEDRTQRVESIGDDEILDWVRTDNYSELAERMKQAGFGGWIPDLEGLASGAEAFDDQGFAKDGSGWVAFNYKPMPSTFWPTNGATDDVMIRLPAHFRRTKEGRNSRSVYLANLTLVEMTIKRLEKLDTPELDETEIGLDLDGDGILGTATSLRLRERFVGAAHDIEVFASMYPQGVEFLHTVRYIDIDEEGNIRPSKRMKEVRYMRRELERRKSWAAYHYLDESLDKEAGKLPRHQPLHSERALQSETGWVVSGFMEGPSGALRVNTFEETFFCMGCHNSVGSTIDKTFSFPRKVDGARGWGYIDLKGMPDAPNMREEIGEIATYLSRVGGGSEFRSNDEMRQKWLLNDGTPNWTAIANAKDVYQLIAPSAERALALNKAYKVIVEDQDFVFGRDPTMAAPSNVYDRVDPATAPVLPKDKQFRWDIRLDWNAAYAKPAQNLSIRARAEAVEIEWQNGNLQTTEKLDGAWTLEPELESPARITPSQPTQFFRVVDSKTPDD